MSKIDECYVCQKTIKDGDGQDAMSCGHLVCDDECLNPDNDLCLKCSDELNESNDEHDEEDDEYDSEDERLTQERAMGSV